ncbi:MAG: class I SAM-dependent methyltransferase [Xanthobacteraceae bacterium]
MLWSINLRAFHSLGPALALAMGCAACFEESGFDYYIPYVPTPQHIVERMLELSEVGDRDYLIDLGSGDGRIAITAAKKYGARALGVDIEPRLVRLADENAAKAGVSDKVTFREQDLFDTKLGEASVIALYLPPAVNMKLRPRLLQELRPGSRVVSHAFHMGGWLADAQETVRGIDIYLWIVPAQVAGHWQIDDGDRRFTLAIEQQFQEITGTATIEGRSLPLRDAKLRGGQIAFMVDFGDGAPSEYRGVVSGDWIDVDGSARSWRATRIAGLPAKQ